MKIIESELIDDQQLGLGQLVHELGIAAIGLSYGELLEESRGPRVGRGIATAAGLAMG